VPEKGLITEEAGACHQQADFGPGRTGGGRKCAMTAPVAVAGLATAFAGGTHGLRGNPPSTACAVPLPRGGGPPPPCGGA
jgi:hypothetical protein